jgi:hypothetical protein
VEGGRPGRRCRDDGGEACGERREGVVANREKEDRSSAVAAQQAEEVLRTLPGFPTPGTAGIEAGLPERFLEGCTEPATADDDGKVRKGGCYHVATPGGTLRTFVYGPRRRAVPCIR